MKVQLSTATVRQLILELDRVEKAIGSASLHVTDADGTVPNPELVRLAAEESAIIDQLATRRKILHDQDLNDWGMTV
ncbi:hypothetical protein [Microlunatus sp. Y2014]|uniref:hypothetical protein n=1 Tax=Microlunatus sp. Y2014 TaxID=3418488 RepID=UPI003DA71BDF